MHGARAGVGTNPYTLSTVPQRMAEPPRRLARRPLSLVTSRADRWGEHPGVHDLLPGDAPVRATVHSWGLLSED